VNGSEQSFDTRRYLLDRDLDIKSIRLYQSSLVRNSVITMLRFVTLAPEVSVDNILKRHKQFKVIVIEFSHFDIDIIYFVSLIFGL
jgi:hypothetical protein